MWKFRSWLPWTSPLRSSFDTASGNSSAKNNDFFFFNFFFLLTTIKEAY